MFSAYIHAYMHAYIHTYITVCNLLSHLACQWQTGCGPPAAPTASLCLSADALLLVRDGTHGCKERGWGARKDNNEYGKDVERREGRYEPARERKE